MCLADKQLVALLPALAVGILLLSLSWVSPGTWYSGREPDGLRTVAVRCDRAEI